MSQRPLRNVRVIDFTWIGAGSFTTKILADFGADVIKIESAGRLDSLREAKPFKDGIAGVNRSGYFADRNSSKRSITLNLKSQRARDLALRLVAKCDVVANNFTPGTMEKFGLGYDDVRRVNPSVVYISMSMQGQTGPEAGYLGYGLTMGALTGLQYLSGKPDREPAGTGTNFPDHVPNPTHAAAAILAALRHRRRTGQGQFIDVAQIEPTIALLGPAVLDYTANAVQAERAGNQQAAGSPQGVYPCAGHDRWIAISATSSQAWQRLLGVLGPLALPDFRQSDALTRWRDRQALNEAIAALTSKWDGPKLMAALQAARVAAGLVNDAADVLHRDPQLAHRQHWTYLDHPEMGRTVYGSPPFKLSRTPGSAWRAAPLLGQHTEEVCREDLGLNKHEIERFHQEGILK